MSGPNAPNNAKYSTVPFPRDTNFVKRGDILDKIVETCLIWDQWTALYGPEGVG